MTLEVDIIVGCTENSMKYLDLPSKKIGQNGPSLKKPKVDVHDRAKKITLATLEDKITENKGHTNKAKINAVENNMTKYFKHITEQK